MPQTESWSEDDIRNRILIAMMREVGDVIVETDLPTMSVLEMAAAAVGTIYREAAAAHSGPDACPCGWLADPATDIEALTRSLQVSCNNRTSADKFALSPIAGSA